jgi:hypothetical protein
VAQWWAVGFLLAGGLGLDVAVSSDVGSGLGGHSFQLEFLFEVERDWF